MNLKKFTELPFYIKLACVLFSLFALVYLAIIAKEILVPMVLACLFSILLLPVAAFLEKKLRFPRSLAALVSILLMLGAVALVFYAIGSQVSGLRKDWPLFQAQLSKSVASLQAWISTTFNVNASEQLDYIHSATDKLMASGTSVAGSALLSVSSVLVFFVFTILYTFFFLLYRTLIMKFLESVFLAENKQLVHEIIEEVQYIIRKYIIGLLTEMLIIAVGLSLVFWMMGIKYAMLLGLITGVFNVIPYVGIFTAGAISILVTFATFSSKVLVVIIALVVTHLIDTNVILPMVVGSKVKINALITTLGLIVGEMIWGIPGMFLSIPVIAVLKIVFDRVESLNSWGIILGDEEKKKPLEKKMRTVVHDKE
jgi:predicted PurR-regulated permease PerM